VAEPDEEEEEEEAELVLSVRFGLGFGMHSSPIGHGFDRHGSTSLIEKKRQ
jgi:hypothetical protein